MNIVERAFGLGVCALIAVVAGCAKYDTHYPRVASSAFREYQTTALGRVFEPAAAAHPGHSGVQYVRYGRNAFADRIAMADLAERSLDLQYYIWDADITGRLIADGVVRAAERGVRVRVLLDDVSVVERDTAIARLSGHPNIQIRAFNPFRDRNRWSDLFTNPSRVNRRSHNKVMIADAAIAIVGGRNIADHYFGVHGVSNYRDLDVVAVGPVVRDAATVFDAFWNSKFAVPYEAFVGTPPTREEADAQIAEMRAKIASEPSPYPVEKDVAALTSQLGRVRDQLLWGPVRVLYDDPSKAEDKTVRGISGELAALAANAEEEVLIENAYFVPRDPMVELAGRLTGRGVSVRVLTNSMASNDVSAVVAGYKKYRDDLLREGVEIYELRPDSAGKQRWSLLSAKSRSGLHTKTMVVDRRYVVIGSFNLDPRSADINTELALLADSSEFGAQVGAFLDDGVTPENSYRVTLDEDGDLRWTTEIDGAEVVYTTEPETGWWKRFVVGCIGLLPIHSQL